MSHMRMAAAMLLTMPGDPFVYYGEEIGMHGVKPDPEHSRADALGPQPAPGW